MGMILFALRRWELPFGSLTLGFTLSTALTVGIHENFEMLPVFAGFLEHDIARRVNSG